MPVTNATHTIDANGDLTALDKIMDMIATDAVAGGWTLLDRYPNVLDGHLIPVAGRSTYGTPRRFWRIEFQGDAIRQHAEEIKLLDLAGVEIDVSEARIFADTEETSPASPVSNAFDASSAVWRSNNTSAGTSRSVYIDFSDGGRVPDRFESIGGLEITQSVTGEYATGIDLFHSPDGVTWTQVYAGRLPVDGGEATFATGLTWTGTETKTLYADYYGNADADRPNRAEGEVLVLRGAGAGAGQEVYLSIASVRDNDLGRYNLQLRQFTAYDPQFPILSQVGVSSRAPYVPIDASECEAWLYVNDRRLILQCRSGSVYNGFYAGLYLPFALPADYLSPIIMIGARDQVSDYLDANTSHRNFFDPGTDCGEMRRADGTQKPVENHVEDTNVDKYISSAATIQGIVSVWPWKTGGTSGSFPDGWEGSYQGSSSGHWLAGVDANPAGDLPIWPALLLDHSSSGLIGALDGVFAIPGSDLTPGQAVTINARNFRAFPNSTRRNGNHWALIEEL
jgi:hypothetical protein